MQLLPLETGMKIGAGRLVEPSMRDSRISSRRRIIEGDNSRKQGPSAGLRRTCFRHRNSAMSVFGHLMRTYNGHSDSTELMKLDIQSPAFFR